MVNDDELVRRVPVEDDESRMRRRAFNSTHRSDDHDTCSADDEQHKFKSHNTPVGRRLLPCGKFLLLTCLLSLFGLFLLAISGIDSTPSNFIWSRVETHPKPSSGSSVAAPQSAPKRNWSHCKILKHIPQTNINEPKLDTSAQVEPLWLPAYPTSLPGKNGAIYSNFLSALTGIKSASRNYYRSSKNLKRCHVLNNQSDIGVTCEIVHPIVPCDRPHPSGQSNNFGKVVLVALRNPMTAFPAFHQEKAEKYHNAKGQVDISEWTAFRDQYVGNATHSPLFEEWKRFIEEWRNMDPYSVAMYLSYERWSDEIKGPALVNNLGRVLKEQGLPVVFKVEDNNSGNPSDLECMWLKYISEAINREEKERIDQGWYIPSYKMEQKQMLAGELDKFANEIRDGKQRPRDEELIDILHEYRDSILNS